MYSLLNGDINLGSRPRLVVPNRQKSDSNSIVPGQVMINKPVYGLHCQCFGSMNI